MSTGKMRILLIKLNQPHDRQAFNRFTTPPEEIDEIHEPPSNQSDPDMRRKSKVVTLAQKGNS